MSEFKLEAFSAEEDILNKGLNRNTPNVSTPGGAFQKFWDNLTGGGGGGGGGSGSDSSTEGGLSAEDQEMKELIYGKIKGMFDQKYEGFEGDRFADRSPEELALLKTMQEGHPMFDKASKELGFSQDIYKKGTEYGVSDLDRDAGALMSGDPYRNEVSERILRDMNRGASMSGMDIRGQGIGAGAAFGDRGDVARLRSNLGYQRQAGEALSNLHYGALRDARSSARQLQQDRLGAAGKYGSTAIQKLGVGGQKLASRYGGFKDDRSYKDRDLGFDYKQWQDKQNFPYKQLGFGSGIYSGMPFEEKVSTVQPASGGK